MAGVCCFLTTNGFEKVLRCVVLLQLNFNKTKFKPTNIESIIVIIYIINDLGLRFVNITKIFKNMQTSE